MDGPSWLEKENRVVKLKYFILMGVLMGDLEVELSCIINSIV